MRRRPRGGQAAVELLALLPALGLLVLIGWQVAAVLAAGMRAEQELRRDALRAGGGAAGGMVVLTREVPLPALLPGLEGLRVRARVGVRTP